MLIWGWRTRSKTLAQGEFYCPSCGVDRHYHHKQARRWFTLFFIPLIPLKVLGEYVECQTCQQGYEMSVLGLPTSAALSEQMTSAAREAIAQLLRIDGGGSSHHRALAVLREISGQAWDDAMLEADIAGIGTDQLPVRLGQLGTVMNEHGKERFLGSLAAVGAGGGVITADTRSALDGIAAQLGMTQAHARGVIDQAVESASS